VRLHSLNGFENLSAGRDGCREMIMSLPGDYFRKCQAITATAADRNADRTAQNVPRLSKKERWGKW
jgi:hypothetical protein